MSFRKHGVNVIKSRAMTCNVVHSSELDITNVFMTVLYADFWSTLADFAIILSIIAKSNSVGPIYYHSAAFVTV